MISQRRSRADSALSTLPWVPFIPITKFAFEHPTEIIPWLTYLQGTTAVRNKIEILLPHVAALDELFATCPDNVAEQGRRSELIRYVVVPPLDLALNSSQRAQGYRGTITVIVRDVRATTGW